MLAKFGGALSLCTPRASACSNRRLRYAGERFKYQGLVSPGVYYQVQHDHFDFGDFTLSGSAPSADGVRAAYAPRRTVLDKILVDAAVEAGAELREAFIVEELLWDGARVTGVRGRAKHGAATTEKARIVIGADGTNSTVARTVQAPVYNVQPTLTCWYYGHYSGVPTDGLEFYLRNRRTLVACYTSHGLTFVGIGVPFTRIGFQGGEDVEKIPGGYKATARDFDAPFVGGIGYECYPAALPHQSASDGQQGIEVSVGTEAGNYNIHLFRRKSQP